MVGIDLPAAHDGRKHHTVGDGKGGNEVIQQHIGAAEGKGLEYRPHPLKVQFLGGGEGGTQLGGVVGIVIGDGRTGVGLAQHLKAAARPGKGRKPGGSLLRGGAQLHGACGGGHGIQDVMVAGDLQVQLGQRLAAEHQGKAAVQPAQVADIGGVVVVGLLPAEGQEAPLLPCRRCHGPAGLFIAAVIQDGMRLFGKFGIAFHGVFHGVEIFHVVVIDIEHQGDIGVGGKEGILEFAGLVHKALRCPAAPVPAYGPQLAADDGGGVQPRHIQDLHDHGGGGGFAVGAANAQRLAVPAGNSAQHFGTLPQRQAAFPRSDQFGVGFHNGGGIEDEIGAPDIFGALPHRHLDAHLAFQFDDVAFVIIAAGDGIAPAV